MAQAVGLDGTADLPSAPLGAASGTVGRRPGAAGARGMVNPGHGGDLDAPLRRSDVALRGWGDMLGAPFPHGFTVGYMTTPAPRAFQRAPPVSSRRYGDMVP